MLYRAILAVAALASPGSALWPIPKSATTGNQTLFIDDAVTLSYNGEPLSYDASYTPPAGPDFTSRDIVQGGVTRALSSIFENGLVPWMLHSRNTDFDPPLDPDSRISKLSITQTGNDTSKTFKPISGTVDESYSLSVTSDGEASLTAASSTGILRGLETFTQLFYQHSSGGAWYTSSAPVEIEDEPEYSHRGVLLDVGRHFFAVPDIERTIDAMAMNKMNILHLHVTEMQSWPLEIPSLPELTAKTAYSQKHIYSPEAIAALHEYAIHRGVQMYLEIDMPGHSGIEDAYPGLTVGWRQKDWQTYCPQPPCGALRLNNTDVEEFLEELFDDLLPRTEPYSAYFHTGGDEYKPELSLLDPNLETSDKKILGPLMERFVEHAHGKVREHGLIPVVWEEVVGDWDITLPEDAVIQAWLGGSVKKLAEEGHKVIDSDYQFYYLDCGRGAWLDLSESLAWSQHYPFDDWCTPYKAWQLTYSHDPRAGISSPEIRENVLGGEVALWSETLDATSLDSIAWPRGGAAAEIWWSGRVDAEGNNRTLLDASLRLTEMRERMVVRGVGAAVIRPAWCGMNAVGDCQLFE